MSEMVISTDPSEAFQRAQMDALQDRCENVHFSSIGGLDKRASDDLMEVPEYIAPHCRRHYIEGYKAACEEMFGPDWRTCEFRWVPVLTISDDETTPKEGPSLTEFKPRYLRRIIACTCGFSAVQAAEGSKVFECYHCGKVQTFPRPEEP